MASKKAQVWIETVLYTLIGLSLIGIVLAIVTPKINQAKERIVVEQTIDSLNVFDEKINDVLEGVGNVRKIPSFTMKKGELYINSSGDSIVFVLKDLGKPYSEPGIPIDIGRVKVISEEKGKSSSVQLILDYNGFLNITYSGEEILKKFTASPTPYSFSITNKGGANETNIDIEETSRR